MRISEKYCTSLSHPPQHGYTKLTLRWSLRLYKKTASLAALLALALASTVAAHAQGNATSTLQANLPVQSACSITSATNFNFAPIPAGILTTIESTNGSLSYACSTKPTSITLVDSAAQFNGEGQAGGFQLQPPTHTGVGTAPIGFFIVGTDSEGDPSVPYLDGLATNDIGANAKSTDTISLVATINPGAKGFTVAAGTYSDTITATIIFS